MTSNIAILGYRSATLVKDLREHIVVHANQEPIIVEPEHFLSSGGHSDLQYMVAVHRDMGLREQLIESVDQQRLPKFTFIHPTALISPDSKIGAGSYIGPFVMVASGAEVGDDCLISPYCLISHRARLGSGSMMQPYSMVAGTSHVGTYCRLNVRSMVLDQLAVTDRVELAAGAMVTREITQPGYYIGSPARLRSRET